MLGCRRNVVLLIHVHESAVVLAIETDAVKFDLIALNAANESRDWGISDTAETSQDADGPDLACLVMLNQEWNADG